ncbi:hypothetical protein AMAG_16730 [Allomyces macrogynus ATCC 38327]|uniref:Uncharacterized protein n=1 Tax=Allomyces macrogynus (strain ATCC 38327) TaxID=578462 RepID=A0A0L0TC00_ALLM3|nr:hypothetical protein AMAG_16730 [Allomyces macrogynus ATCC 38327]|eukprot:KNE72246.1 hypothetical protein AMAG_16730 [Allomyces macrogynus ATCC 38327]
MFLFRKTIDIVERAAEVVVPRIRPRDDQLKEQWALILAWYRDRGFQWVLASAPSTAQHGMSMSMSATIRPGQLPSPSTSPVDLAQTVTAATLTRTRTRSPSASYRAGQYPRGDTESDDQLYSGAIPTLAESGVGTALANILRLVEEELHTASSRSPRSVSPTPSSAMSSSTFAFLDRDRDRHAELRGLYGVPRSASNQSPYYSPTSPTFAQRTNSSLISPGSSQSSLAEQDIGPCLEFTMNNDFLVNLADMGSQDIPIGMTNEVVRFFTVFVTYVEQLNKGSLLPERSVRVPLGHLLTSVHGMIAALRAMASTRLDAQRADLELDWLNLVAVVFRSLSRVPINIELLLEPVPRDDDDDDDDDDDEDMDYDFPLLMQLLDVATRPASAKVGELAKALLLGAAEWLVLDGPVQDALAAGGFAHTLVEALVDCPALDSMAWFYVINRFLLPFPRSSPVIDAVADALEALFQPRRVLNPLREEEEEDDDDQSPTIATHVLVPPRLAPSLIPRLIATTIDLHPRLRIALLTCMPTTLLAPSAPSSPSPTAGLTNDDEWTALTTLDLYADLLGSGDAHLHLPPSTTPCMTPPATLAARLIHTGLDLLHARLRKTADPASAVADTAIAILSDVHAAYLARPRVVDAPAVTIVAADVADLWHAAQLPEPVAVKEGSSDSLDLGSPWRAGIVLALTTVLRGMALARDEAVAWWVFGAAGVMDEDVLARIPFGDRRVAAEFHLEMGLILLVRLAYARYGPGSIAQAEVVRMWRVLCEDADAPD